MEDGTWPSPAGPLLSKLAIIFVQVIAYAHVTRQEALDIIGFMLSTHSCIVHEQLLLAFIQLGLLEQIPSSSYYRIANAQVSGVFTPVASCYSSTCDYRRPCYSPCCPLQKAHSDLFTSTNTWLQRIPKHILQKTHRNELLRQAAIADLLSMEQSYLADLHVLDEVYSKPLLMSTCISESYRESFHMLLFGNHGLISKLHQRFCVHLIKQCQKPNQLLFGKVGEVIHQHIQTLIDPYIQYTGNHIRSSYALRMERHRNPSFCRFVDVQNSQPRTRRLSLGHFLSAPTLWIGKYRMLVEALAKRSDSASEDRPILQQCVVMLQDLLSHMNQAATNAGHDTRRAHVTACLTLSISSYSPSVDTTFGWPQQWMFPHDAKLLREGKMWLQRSTPSPLPTATSSQCHLFLFDHMLFITNAKLVDGIEEYSLAGRPIPLAAFAWLDGEHCNPSSPFIHRFSRQLSSRLSAKSSTIWSTIRRTPSSTFQPPSSIDSLSSSKSTPIASPPVSLPSTCQSLGSASRLKRRLRSNRWSSSPTYTHSSSAIQSLSLPVTEQHLNRRQSVPELSYSSSNREQSSASHMKASTLNCIKKRHQKVTLSPLTPITSNDKRASSTYSSTTTTSSSSISEIPEIIPFESDSPTPDVPQPTPSPSIEFGDRKSRYIQFCHVGSMETPYLMDFDDTQECQEWRNAIDLALLRVERPYKISPIWEQSNITLKKMSLAQQQDEWSSFKKMSSAPWASISTSTSLSPTNVITRRKSDPDEDLHHMQIHCALSYETDDGDKMLALGTQDGVWIGTEHYMDSTDHHAQCDLQQIIPVPACHRLALINGMLVAMAYNPKHKYSLVAYPLLIKSKEDAGDKPIQQGRKPKDTSATKKSWCVVKRDWVIAMAVGRLYHQVVMVYLTRYGNHILAVVAIPRTQSPYFKKVKEYTVRLKDANNISIHDNTLYIQSNKYGVESIIPSRKRETSVQWQHILHSPCIDYIPLSADRGLSVTISGVRPIDLTGSPCSSSTCSRDEWLSYMDGIATHKNPGLFDFESRITSISIDYPYIIAYGLSLVEIWNIELNELVQVIHSPSIRRLYDSSQCFIDDKKQCDRSILIGVTSSNKLSYRIHQLKLQ